jgi:hypothetical protein
VVCTAHKMNSSTAEPDWCGVHHQPQPPGRDGAVPRTITAQEGVKQASTQSSLLLARVAKHCPDAARDMERKKQERA